MTALEPTRAHYLAPTLTASHDGADTAASWPRDTQWLAILDALILVVVGCLGLVFRHVVYPYPDSTGRMAVITGIHVAVWIIGLHALGLYRTSLRTSSRNSVSWSKAPSPSCWVWVE